MLITFRKATKFCLRDSKIPSSTITNPSLDIRLDFDLRHSFSCQSNSLEDDITKE